VLFYPKPALCYTDTATFDGVDLRDIDIGNGESVTAEQEASKYLGSYATRAGTDLSQGRSGAHIKGQSGLRCAQALPLPTKRRPATEVNRSVYCGLILAMLLYGAEHWCLAAKMVRVLRAFHHRWLHAVQHVKWTSGTHATTTSRLRPSPPDPASRPSRPKLHDDRCDYFGTCGGYRRRGRLPQKRPVGRPELTYGQTAVRTVRAVEADRGLAQPAAAVAAAAAAVAAAVATKAVDVVAAAALRHDVSIQKR
jgi:hypothetical protein